MEAVLLVWLVCGFVGALVGSSKGKAGAGAVLGFLLGVIGLIIIAVMKPSPEFEAKKAQQAGGFAPSLGVPGTLRRCPSCAEDIQASANVCKHCGRDVTPVQFAPPPNGTAAQVWLADPSGRHPLRWWDGSQWTQWVGDKPGGTQSEDPPVPTPVS